MGACLTTRKGAPVIDTDWLAFAIQHKIMVFSVPADIDEAAAGQSSCVDFYEVSLVTEDSGCDVFICARETFTTDAVNLIFGDAAEESPNKFAVLQCQNQTVATITRSIRKYRAKFRDMVVITFSGDHPTNSCITVPHLQPEEEIVLLWADQVLNVPSDGDCRCNIPVLLRCRAGQSCQELLLCSSDYPQWIRAKSIFIRYDQHLNVARTK